MPTAVEYEPEGNSDLPAVQSNGVQSPSESSPGLGSRFGLFLGGVFVMIIAVLIIIVCFGPRGLVLGMFGPMMAGNEQQALSCLPGAAVSGPDIKPPSPNDVAIGDPGKPPSPNHVSLGDGSVSIAFQFVQGLNSLRVGMGGANMTLYATPCSSDSAPLPPPLPPATEEPTATEPPPGHGPEPDIPTATAVNNAPHDNPSVCTPNPSDGMCSACENTDLDSNACVCNNNGVCDPHEGFNCGDCMPTSTGGDNSGGGGKKKTPCPAGAVCP